MGKPEPATGIGRRGAILWGAAALAALWWWRGRPGDDAYRPHPRVEGFREVAGGEVSQGAFDPFIGISDGRPQVPPVADADLCAALFRGAGGPGVRVASFSDYFCPYCRVLTQELAQRAAAGTISVAWHELPLLSQASEVAARAALAAERQDGYVAFHARLMRARFQPNEAYLTEIAAGAGLDAQRLLADMESDAVRARLAESAGVAARFGFAGTPALVIGQTVIEGSVSPGRLDRLIAAERAAGPGRCG